MLAGAASLMDKAKEHANAAASGLQDHAAAMVGSPAPSGSEDDPSAASEV